MTMPTAFTVSMLAWGALAFPNGFQKARQMPHVLQTMRWGSDYLMKTWKPDTLGPGSAGYLIVYQVCGHTAEQHVVPSLLLKDVRWLRQNTNEKACQLLPMRLLLCCKPGLAAEDSKLQLLLCDSWCLRAKHTGTSPVWRPSPSSCAVPEAVQCMHPHSPAPLVAVGNLVCMARLAQSAARQRAQACMNMGCRWAI